MPNASIIALLLATVAITSASCAPAPRDAAGQVARKRALPLIASRASTACSSGTWTRIASPARSRWCSATGSRSTSARSAGATRRPERRMTPTRSSASRRRQGDHQRRHPGARRGRQDRPRRSRQPLHSRRSPRRRSPSERHGVAIVPAQRADHDSRSADAHRRHLVRHRARRRRRCYEAKGWARRRLRLVHGRQGRADLRHDGAARHAAVRRAAGRSLGLRLQHRHPRLRRRARVRHAARRVRANAHHRAARHEGHAVLPAAGAARRGWRPCTRAAPTARSRARRRARAGQGHYVEGPRRSFCRRRGARSRRRATTRASSR